MGFDDLARHMAARDGKKPKAGAANIDNFVAEAAELDRQLARKRDLILGPVLLVGGLVILVLGGLYLLDAMDPRPDPLRPPETGNTYLVPTGAMAFAAGMVLIGLRKTVRGIRGQSRGTDADEL